MKTKLVKKPKFMDHPDYPGVLIAGVVGDDLSSDYRCAIVKVLPGGEILPHIHENLEVAHIMEGEGLLLLNGDYEEIKQGETMYAPADVVHGIKNESDEKMILFATFPNCKY